MSRLYTILRSSMTSYPLMTNCLVYGSMSGMAEFSQQTLLYKVFPKKDEKQKYNGVSILHYSMVGGCVFSPTLHYWYRWLDRVVPGVGGGAVVKKVVLDIVVFGVPYYTVFYTLLNTMAGESVETTVTELQDKLLPTMVTTGVFWVPAQIINFRFVLPRMRIIYLAACTFVEFNILALFKKWDGKTSLVK